LRINQFLIDDLKDGIAEGGVTLLFCVFVCLCGADIELIHKSI